MFNNDNGFALSDRFIDKAFAGRGFKKDVYRSLAIRSRSFDQYDFNVKALDTTNIWTVAAGGTATTWAVRAEAGGWIRGVTGTTTASAGLQLSIPQKYWTGASNAGVGFLYKASVVEGITFEMGFVDALPSVNTTVVNSATTPTYNTSVDAAFFLYQHTGNATAVPDRVGLYTNNSSAATGQKSVLTVASLGAAPGPAANTEHFVWLEVNGTTVQLFIGDMETPTATLTNAVTSANGLIPFVSVKGNNSTSKNFDIDMIATWSGRLA